MAVRTARDAVTYQTVQDLAHRRPPVAFPLAQDALAGPDARHTSGKRGPRPVKVERRRQTPSFMLVGTLSGRGARYAADKARRLVSDLQGLDLGFS